MGAVPFFGPRKVVRFPDSLPAMDESTRVAADGVLMNLLSLCASGTLPIGDRRPPVKSILPPIDSLTL
jgi:hypothetical protein